MINNFVHFKEWFLKECGVGTFAVYNPKMKLKDAIWSGAVGPTSKTISGNPIKHWVKKGKNAKKS